MADPDRGDDHGHAGEAVQTDAHGGAHGGEALGPIDVAAWATAVLGTSSGSLSSPPWSER